ncbi:glycosyltransferase [Leptolyngbya ohadii]|uniref:glycosyltransferase n=1 Tax=Leptolyngbya ohadii TaxID=1962290 RepID=UPI000B598CDA|nr:glycosyltransferase [Leptolyngbya ohadii]
MNDLQLYFESNDKRLIHKWTHYFEIYDRHFSRFRNTDVCILEIGVYHGGSLQMWRNYFGPYAKIIGVDIDPRCKELEEEGIEIIIGDQEDREFLASLRSKLPPVDILIDDGGHTMRQQIITFEELFPLVKEDGVYLCEDLHTSYWQEYGGGYRNPNSFIEYSKAFIDQINAWHSCDPGSFRVNDVTRSAYCLHFYTSVLVIDKRSIAAPVDRMTGQFSFADFHAEQFIKAIEADQPQLKCEIYKPPESVHTMVAELNARYAEAMDLQQKTQIHANNLEAALEQTRTHASNLETALEQTRIHAGNLEAALKQSQDGLEQTRTQLQQATAELKQLKKEKERELEQAQAEIQNLRSHADFLQVHLNHANQELKQKQDKMRSLRKVLETREAEVLRAQDRISAMETSKFWQFRLNWFRVKQTVGLTAEDIAPFKVTDNLPQLPQARTQPAENKPVVVQPAVVKPVLDPYERWMQKHTPQAEDLKQMKQIAQMMAYKPLISVIVPVYNTPEAFLRDAIESVLAQVYPHWELCLADDASPDPHVREVLEEYAGKDDRIKVVFREENGHISRCSNSALELATGEYIALLDHDDTLPPEALYEVAFLLNQHPEADMVYSDEDKLDASGKRCHPYFKPDWCPDTFLSWMYTCHLGVYRRSVINEISGFRVGYEGSQDYDLVLRFTEKTDKIFHIPKILYHWRIHEQSAASGIEAKPYAYIAAEKAIAEALERRGTPGRVEGVPNYGGCYIVSYDIVNPGKVSIIIPTRDLGRLVNQCLDSIFTKTTYPNYEVILIDNGSTEAYTEKVINDWLNREPERFRCYSLPIPFNYSKLNNFGVSKASGDYLLFLNNDTEVLTPDWLEIMVGHAQRKSVGAVGSLLLYPDDTIQHAGVTIGMGGVAGHLYVRMPRTESGYFGQLRTVTNYSAVTGACLMCRRDVFEAVGGFNEAMPVAFNDIDLCLRIVQQGYHNLCTTQAVLYHYESKSRGYEDTPEKQLRFSKECEYMRKTWQEFCEHDPCYSPHLSLNHSDCRIRE